MEVMESFTLDSNNKVKEFEFNSKDSYLLIKSVSLLLEENNNISWMQLLPIIQLKAVVKYTVIKDANNRFSDERTNKFSLNLILDINQTQPVFNINYQIKNDSIKIGWNDTERHYSTIKIELIEIKEINVNYSIQFFVEKYKIV
jgi:hypothetical protein